MSTPSPEAATPRRRGARVPLRTWRRGLTSLARMLREHRPTAATSVLGAARPERGGAVADIGPHAVGLAADEGPWRPSARPRQGRLGDCWVMAAMLAVHETAPERLQALIRREPDGTATVQLPGADGPMRVERTFPVGSAGGFVYGRQQGSGPGWVGVLEKAVAMQVAGGYRFLQRGLGRYGLQVLLGVRGRMLLRLPSAHQIVAWRAEHRAILASTHPLSGRVVTAHGRLPANHVFAVVGAELGAGHLLLRNPWRPDDLLRIDARTFRRGFISVDVTPPLR